MNYPFTYALTVEGRPIAEIEGVAVLAGDPFTRDRSGEPTDWTVTEVLLHEIGPGQRRMVQLPDEHPLHDRLLADVLAAHRQRMDEAWARHMATRRRGALALVS